MIVISGLRRFGTTALWQCFRGIDGVAAFDEPFHPRLADGARDNPKGTWTELADFLDVSGAVPVVIGPEAELFSGSTPAERTWMADLSDAAPRVAIDLVRGWNRLPALYPDPKAVVTVQLVREPAGWVTAHMMPSGRGTWRKPLADMYRRASFFSRRGFFNNYHYETIISAALAQDHPLWRAVAMPLADLRRAPAYVRLLAFWWGANLATHQALVETDAPRRIVTLGEFSADPRGVLGTVADTAGWNAGALRSNHVKPTRASFGTAHPAWARAARALDIPVTLVAPGGATAAAIGAAFDAALAAGREAR